MTEKDVKLNLLKTFYYKLQDLVAANNEVTSEL